MKNEKDLKEAESPAVAVDTVLAAVYLDGNGNVLNNGDKVVMTLYGLGSGQMDIVEIEGDLYLYDVHQGSYPLKDAVKRSDMFLESID